MPVIQTTDDLAAFCERLSAEPYITVDTEFMREKTYYPQLCLIQLAGKDEARAVDPLAPGMDLSPLFKVMENPNILKVFHAARQDLEIFYHLMGKVPAPMFDSQVAAMVCGFGDSISYENLAARLAKARIDKSSRFTDWARRPLTDKQITYALSDVTHLRVIYEKLDRKLKQNGRAHWLNEEMAVLTSPGTYDVDPMEIWRRIKGRGTKPRMLAVLRELAAWREREVQRRDLPRNRFLRDEALMEIAHHTPKSVDDLARTRGLGRGLAEGSQGVEILAAVQRGLDLPEEDCPQLDTRPPLPKGVGPVADLMKVLLKMRCEEEDVAQRLVASSDDVEQLAGFGEESGVAALSGWRREIFGEDALKLREGRLGIAIRGKHLVLIPMNGDPA